MARKQSAEAKILNLYDELSEDGKRIVFDLLRSKQPKKSATTKKSTRKSARPAVGQSSPKPPRKGLPQSTEGQKENVTGASRQGGDGSEDQS